MNEDRNGDCEPSVKKRFCWVEDFVTFLLNTVQNKQTKLMVFEN